MPDIGSNDKAVNSRKFNIFISNTGNEFIHLQDARLGIQHTETPEDTTSGGTVYFTSNDRNFVEGTFIYNEGMFDATPGGITIESLLTEDNTCEVPTEQWLVRFTSKDQSTDTYTFNAKMESFNATTNVSDGSSKAEIRLVIIGKPVVS